MDIGKMVGAATAPVNLIISAAIAISFLVGKQGALFAKFEVVCDEHRKGTDDPEKHEKLGKQLSIYGRRLQYIGWASQALAFAILIFILTVLATLFSLVYPELLWLKAAIGLTMTVGLLSMFLGIALEVFDTVLDSGVIASDLKELNSVRQDLPPNSR